MGGSINGNGSTYKYMHEIVVFLLRVNRLHQPSISVFFVIKSVCSKGVEEIYRTDLF